MGALKEAIDADPADDAREITFTEAEDLEIFAWHQWFTDEMITGLPNWAFLCCIGGLIVIGIIVYCVWCKKKDSSVQDNGAGVTYNNNNNRYGTNLQDERRR